MNTTIIQIYINFRKKIKKDYSWRAKVGKMKEKMMKVTIIKYCMTREKKEGVMFIVR